MSSRRGNGGGDSRRGNGGNDSRRYYEWLDKAQADLQSARLLLSVGASPGAVVFHCQQVAEKALKAFLLYREGRHYDGHNITFLLRRAIRKDPDFQQFLAASPPFNLYYIESRYPTDLPFHIEESDIADAFWLSQELYRMVARKIFGELSKTDDFI